MTGCSPPVRRSGLTWFSISRTAGRRTWPATATSGADFLFHPLIWVAVTGPVTMVGSGRNENTPPKKLKNKYISLRKSPGSAGKQQSWWTKQTVRERDGKNEIQTSFTSATGRLSPLFFSSLGDGVYLTGGLGTMRSVNNYGDGGDRVQKDHHSRTVGVLDMGVSTPVSNV